MFDLQKRTLPKTTMTLHLKNLEAPMNKPDFGKRREREENELE
jgi:hypothetical protein